MNYNNIGNKSIVSTKWVLIITVLFFSVLFGGLFFCTPAHAQVKPFKNTGKVLKDTVIKEVKYVLYVGAKGGKYIVRTSAKGNIYKMYIKAKK